MRAPAPMQEPLAPPCFFAPMLSARVKAAFRNGYTLVSQDRYEEVFARFGMRYMDRSDWSGVKEWIPWMDRQQGARLNEVDAALLRSGRHDCVALYLQEPSGMPCVQASVGIKSGQVLGQLATTLYLDQEPKPLMGCETLESAVASCFTWRVPIKMAMRDLHSSPERAASPPRKRASLGQANSAPRLHVKDWPQPLRCLAAGCAHVQGGTYPCASQEEWFAHLRDVASRVKATERGYRCPWEGCNVEGFKSTADLERHLQHAHGRACYRCDHCKQLFEDSSTARRNPLCMSCSSDELESDRSNGALHTEDAGVRGGNGALLSGKRSAVSPKFTGAGAAMAGGGGPGGAVGQSLVNPLHFRFEAGKRCNIFGLLQASSLHNVSPNVQLALAFLDGVPTMFVEAIEDIPAGTELRYDWGDQNIARLLRTTLWAQASQAHLIHIHRRRLEMLHNMYQIPRPTLTPLVPLEENMDILWMHYLRRGSLNIWDYAKMEKMQARYTLDQKFPLQGLETGFAASKCKLLERTDVSPEAKKMLMSMPAHERPPRWQDLFHDRLDMARKLMYTTESPNVELRRIDCLHHPVRFLNPPSKPQYGLFAKQRIAGSMPIVCYKGEVVTKREYDRLIAPQYTFDFCMPIGVHIDADDFANEGRFANDCFARVWNVDLNAPHASSGANACYISAWDDTYGHPVLFIMAERSINKEEEIIVDYGQSGFWNPLMHELGRQHASSYNVASQICAHLEANLRRHSIPVAPRLSWEQLTESDEGNLFALLPAGSLEYVLEQEEFVDDVPIERIVDKRVMPFGVQYRVKWENYDWSHNTWVHAADLPEAIVEEYEASEKKAAAMNLRQRRRSRH